MKEIRFLQSLQISNNQIFQEPRGRATGSTVVVPNAKIVQPSQRPRDQRERERDLERVSPSSQHSLGNRHDEGIDTTALQDTPMGIVQHPNMSFIIISGEDEGHLSRKAHRSVLILSYSHYFGFRSSIFSMAGENENLVIIFISRVIVDHRCHSQLERTMGHSLTSLVLPSRCLSCLCNARRS